MSNKIVSKGTKRAKDDLDLMPKGAYKLTVRKPKRGRPKMDESEALVTDIKVSLTKPERAVISHISEDIGFRSVSQFLRYCITNTLRMNEGKKGVGFDELSELSEVWYFEQVDDEVEKISKNRKQMELF